MPCFDPRDNEPTIIYADGIDPEILKSVQLKLDQVTSLLCSTCMVLEDESLMDSVLLAMSDENRDSLLSWWGKHKKFDENRIRNDVEEFLDKYTSNEQRIIKKILNKG